MTSPGGAHCPMAHTGTRVRMGLVLCFAAVLPAAAAGPGVGARQAHVAREPTSSGGAPGFRRLNEDQYKRSIAQIFGADIKGSRSLRTACT